MKNKGLVIIIVGVAIVALAVVLLAPAALAYGSQNGYGLGFNQLVGEPGSRMGQGQGMRQDGAMMRGGGQGQGRGMMQDGATMGGGRGQGQGQGMMQDGAMMGSGRGQGQGQGNNGAGLGLGAPEASLMTVVAEQLGLEQADLVAELQAGQTLADVITTHGVELNTVVDAFLAPRADQLAEKVANEEITQVQADSYLAMMKAKVTEQLNSEWRAGQGNGPGNGYGPGNSDGTCNHTGQGQGGNFVDEDGDGVCDHAGTGSGQQMGRQGGRMGASQGQ